VWTRPTTRPPSREDCAAPTHDPSPYTWTEQGRFCLAPFAVSTDFSAVRMALCNAMQFYIAEVRDKLARRF